MSKLPVSVGILTFNSATTLRRALESVRDFDDIVVCDGGSTDNTLEIAREFGAQIIVQDAQFKNPDNTLANYSGVRNQLLKAAKHDWFLYIDSDETISNELKEEIVQAVQNPTNVLVYRVPIGVMMDGRYIKYSSNYPGYQHRFFNKKSGAHFVKPVHERIEFDARTIKVGTFVHPWYVHSTRQYWHRYLANAGKYRTDAVRQACKAPFADYLRYTLWWHLRASASVVVKSVWNYSVHGFADSIPVRGELGRAAVPLVHIWQVTQCRIGSLFT